MFRCGTLSLHHHFPPQNLHRKLDWESADQEKPRFLSFPHVDELFFKQNPHVWISAYTRHYRGLPEEIRAVPDFFTIESP